MLEATLYKVLAFYDAQGVPLGYWPTVEQVETDYMREMALVARIGTEVAAVPPHQPSLSRLFARRRSACLWREVYGLHISRDAIEELNTLVKARHEVRTETPAQADIILYPSFTWSGNKEWYAAHEVWHLIEADRGLLGSEPIREGTASYAAARFLGRENDELYLRPPRRCGDMLALRRSGVGYIVKEHVGGSPYPFRAMLDPAVRWRIQEDALQRCEPVVLDLAQGAARDADYVEDFTRYIRRTLAKAELDGRVTPESITEAYRRIGAERLAEELASQDLSRFAEDLRETG